MFERYTEQARRVLFFARYEASQLGSVSIEPQHLLLGLIRDGKVVHRILASTNISLEDLASAVTAQTPFQEKISTSVEMPFSQETKRVLQYSAEESDRLLHRHIGAEHLLLGLLREEQSVAASLLRRHGLQLSAARDLVALLLKEMLPDSSTPLGAGVPGTETLTLKLSGYTGPGKELFRNMLFDQMVASLPRESEAKVQIYNAEIAPGGYTNWHCHNGTTFFIALQGIFEAEFEEGILIKAKAGDVYSEPIGKFHRGHNPHPDLAYLCIGVCITPPDQDHVTNVPDRPW